MAIYRFTQEFYLRVDGAAFAIWGAPATAMYTYISRQFGFHGLCPPRTRVTSRRIYIYDYDGNEGGGNTFGDLCWAPASLMFYRGRAAPIGKGAFERRFFRAVHGGKSQARRCPGLYSGLYYYAWLVSSQQSQRRGSIWLGVWTARTLASRTRSLCLLTGSPMEDAKKASVRGEISFSTTGPNNTDMIPPCARIQFYLLASIK